MNADVSTTHTKIAFVEFLDKADKTAAAAGHNLKSLLVMFDKADVTAVQMELGSKTEVTSAYDKTAIDQFLHHKANKTQSKPRWLQ